jgi:hypothetical protein
MKALGSLAETVKIHRRDKRAQAGQIENHRLANLINDFETARYSHVTEPSRMKLRFSG